MSTSVAVPRTDRVKGRPAQLWTSTVARIALGAILISAGGLKIVNPDQAAAAVQAYRIFPPAVGELIGYALPVLEIAIGILLIVGLGTRLAAIVTAVMMVAFITGVASAWARGLRIDCGCFGGGGDLAADAATKYVQEIVRDLLFLGLAVWLIIFPSSRFALDRPGVAGTGDTGLVDELDDLDEFDDEDDAEDVNDDEEHRS